MEIKNSTTVHEALKKSREVARVFRKYNLACPGCRGAGEDTIEKVATNNGLDLKVFLSELNAAIR